MVLVDTSVWIRFLARKSPFTAEVDRLLDLQEVAGHDLVYGELLMGDRGGRRTFLPHFEKLHKASQVSHHEAIEFVRQRRLYGRGIGWVDAHLLASAVIDRLRIWTADQRLATIAEELNLAHKAPQVN